MQKWLIDQLGCLESDAHEEAGRWKGKAEAFKEVMVLADTKERCQACGERFYSDTERADKHYKNHPECNHD